jgi:hypothetical protein
MTYPHLIGLSGKAGSGKDAVGEMLRRRGYEALAFADPLKEICALAFGYTARHLHGDLKEVVDHRHGHAPRWLLQYLGTEVFRGIWPEIWVWHLEDRLRRHWAKEAPAAKPASPPVVVTDVRFVDEAQMLRRLGAKLIRLERDGAAAVHGIPGHCSETELDAWPQWDLVLQGSLEEIEAALGQWLAGDGEKAP